MFYNRDCDHSIHEIILNHIYYLKRKIQNYFTIFHKSGITYYQTL